MKKDKITPAVMKCSKDIVEDIKNYGIDVKGLDIDIEHEISGRIFMFLKESGLIHHSKFRGRS